MADYTVSLTTEQEVLLLTDVFSIQTYLDNVVLNKLNVVANKKLPIGGGGDGSGEIYVQRSDCSYDFSIPDFITDGQSHVLDLSNILPVGATAARIFFQVKADVTGRCVTLRSLGYVDYNKYRLTALTPGRPTEGETVIAVGPDRKIEYLATNAVFTSIVVTVRGWFIPVA